MGTMNTTRDLEKTVNELLSELEALTTEIELKMKLAGMDARDKWNEIEPKLYEARVHAKGAKEEAKKAVAETLKVFKEFAAAL